ncbi:MAG TPA: T9SS type A sorting domain-containing protein, partial [Bacteroidota bacterium]
IYEYSGGYLSTAPDGSRDHLLQTAYQAFMGGGSASGTPPASPSFTAPAYGAVLPGTSTALTWTKVSGATGYQVQLSTDSTFAATMVNDSSLIDTVKAVSGLTPGGVYFARVRAKNSAGWGAYSARDKFSVSAQTLAAPVLVSPANGASQQPVTETLVWNTSSGASLYELQVALDAGFTTMVLDSTLSATSATAGPLNRKTLYYWRVRAKSSLLTSAFSAAWTFRTEIKVPKSPTTLAVVSVPPPPALTYTLFWTPDSNATAYHLQVSEDTLFTTMLVDTTCRDTAVAGLEFSSTGTLFARVRSENAAGVSAYTLISFRTLTGVDDRPAIAVTDFALHQNYPNPFNPSTTLAFDVPVQSDVSVRIYNMLGMEMATLYNGPVGPGRHSVVWNAAGAPSGTYFCRFKAGSHIVVRRLLLLK